MSLHKIVIVLLFALLFTSVEAFRVPHNSRSNKSGGRRKHSQRAVDEFRVALQKHFDRRAREAPNLQCAIPNSYGDGSPEVSSGICTEDQRHTEEVLAAFQENLTRRAREADRRSEAMWWWLSYLNPFV